VRVLVIETDRRWLDAEGNVTAKKSAAAIAQLQDVEVDGVLCVVAVPLRRFGDHLCWAPDDQSAADLYARLASAPVRDLMVVVTHAAEDGEAHGRTIGPLDPSMAAAALATVLYRGSWGQKAIERIIVDGETALAVAIDFASGTGWRVAVQILSNHPQPCASTRDDS
jgi:hypothetical protein